jgi:hypothetical protein
MPMRTIVRAFVAVAVATCLALLGAAVAQADIYWANARSNTIGRATVAGGSVNQSFLSTGTDSGGGVAVDGTYVYWSQWSGAIGRAKLDGSAPDPNFITGLSHTPSALAVDAGHIYWAQPNDAAIGRANLDGSSVDEGLIATDPSGSPDGVAVDAQFVYWADANTAAIGRANLDGTGVDSGFISGLGTPRSVTTDGTWLYWGDIGEGAVGRALVGGTGVDPDWLDFGTPVFGTTAVGGFLYWTEPLFNSIGAVRLSDLSGAEEFITGADLPEQVAVLSAGAVVTGSGAFGNVVVGADATQSYTVTNNGNAPLIFAAGAVTLTGANANQWSLTVNTCAGQTIPAGGTCTVTARLNPTSAGSKSATLRFSDNAPGSPHTVSLTGRGTTATFSAAPASQDFGGVRVGTTSAAQTFTISNTATGANAGPMTIPAGGVTLTGADASQFAVGADACSGTTVAAGSSCTVAVTFSPTSTGATSANLHVADNATGAPHDVALAGTGTEPALSVAPAGQDFGAVLLGATSPPQTFTLTNAGGAASVLGTVTLAGGGAGHFAVGGDTCSGTTLGPGASCTVSATFGPTAVGGQTATLQFPNDAGAPPTAALSGFGVVFVPPSPSGGSGGSGGGGSGGGGSGASGPSSTPSAPSTAAGGDDHMSVGLLRRKLTASRRGAITLRLRCEGTTLRRCAGTLRVLRRVGERTVRLSTVRRVRYRVDAGTSARVVIRLRASVRKQLARSCASRHAIVRIMVKQADGSTTGHDRHIALRRVHCR